MLVMTLKTQKQRPASRIDPVPDTLDSAQAKLVYIYLEATDGATVEELGATLAMQKLSILSVLNTLSSAGIVEQDGDEYVVSN
ncbi:MarR family transcriptional regulator (plasmid) [Natronorubrum bangense]|uniref:MarR family transcriptional regulator n=2 Tax=Natronorubrum bangense TaxID=61858 RepID=A0A4D6HRY5_9EURY|nr:MarR family transcriptional regulator [Natronorubrum bangense]QCC56729.1 MarR family transcriptional regulator [Natronorubrum bangense]